MTWQAYPADLFGHIVQWGPIRYTQNTLSMSLLTVTASGGLALQCSDSDYSVSSLHAQSSEQSFLSIVVCKCAVARRSTSHLTRGCLRRTLATGHQFPGLRQTPCVIPYHSSNSLLNTRALRVQMHPSMPIMIVIRFFRRHLTHQLPLLGVGL